MGNFFELFYFFSITFIGVKMFKETKRTSVIKFANYFLRVTSKMHLIKGFEYGMSLLLPADTCFLLFKA